MRLKHRPTIYRVMDWHRAARGRLVRDGCRVSPGSYIDHKHGLALAFSSQSVPGTYGHPTKEISVTYPHA